MNQGIGDQHISREDQNISSVDQDPSTGVQDGDQDISRYQDIPRDQDTSLMDPSTSQVTSPPATTVTQVMEWNLSNVDIV